MKLQQLAALLHCEAGLEAGREVGREVTGITEDSRRVRPGMVFVAAPGVRSDGHAYAEKAAESGAVAVIGSRPETSRIAGIPYLYSANPRQALGIIAHELAGNPSRGMTVIGITGTNGKSSSVLLARQVLETCGFSAAAFGTLGYTVGGKVLPADHTTPFGEDLAEIFRKAKAAGHTHVAMEVSSHSLEQERVAGIEFRVAEFTNLTQDHLDYHGDMANYRMAKIKLFERVTGPGAFTVVNIDDPSADYFVKASRVPCISYGAQGDCRARDVRNFINKTEFIAVTPWGECAIRMNLVGRHNIANTLGIIAVCGGLGCSLDKIAEGVAALACVPGRFEGVDGGQPFLVVVDYAHTDDGLKNVLEAAREICKGRVIAVFGCGGDRDKTKRPKMGAVAAGLADVIYVTSDNPRTEEPLAIIADILPGVRTSQKKEGEDCFVMPDRTEAIRAAIGSAHPGDLVIIAGKGHEDYQIIGTTKMHFDDREVARAILESIGYDAGNK
jgi:UDP-N-acetylmuramoyl-L-alanyl-D-glutamate--2,6-diaminopimelate ligase